MGAMTDHVFGDWAERSGGGRCNEQPGPAAVPSVGFEGQVVPPLTTEGVRPAAQSRTHALPPLAGIATALKILGCSRSTLYRWLDAGRMIVPQQIDSGPVWVRSDVEEFAAARSAGEPVD